MRITLTCWHNPKTLQTSELLHMPLQLEMPTNSVSTWVGSEPNAAIAFFHKCSPTHPPTKWFHLDNQISLMFIVMVSWRLGTVKLLSPSIWLCIYIYMLFRCYSTMMFLPHWTLRAFFAGLEVDAATWGTYGKWNSGPCAWLILCKYHAHQNMSILCALAKGQLTSHHFSSLPSSRKNPESEGIEGERSLPPRNSTMFPDFFL